MSHFVNCPLSPLLCYSLKITNYEQEKRKFSWISYMACPAYHIISREVENQIFRHNFIFRCSCIYKQPKMTKLWNCNIFVQLLCSYLTSTIIGFSMCFFAAHCNIIRVSCEANKKRLIYRKKYAEEFVWRTSFFWLHVLLFMLFFCLFFSLLRSYTEKNVFAPKNVGQWVPMSSPQCLQTWIKNVQRWNFNRNWILTNKQYVNLEEKVVLT